MGIWLGVNKNGSEWIFESEPYKDENHGTWECEYYSDSVIQLPKGTIERILGRKLTWNDNIIKVEKYGMH